MIRLFTPNREKWYDSLHSVASYSELEVEIVLQQYSAEIFTDYHTLLFKPKDAVEYNGSKKIPDLVLIKKDYKAWIILEVELSHHTVRDVVDQVETFIEGDWDMAKVKAYIMKKAKQAKISLDEEKIDNMLNQVEPEVFVGIDKDNINIKKAVKDRGARYFIFELYRAPNGKRAYRLLGDYPFVEASSSSCKMKSRNGREIIVHDKNVLVDVGDDEELVVNYEDEMVRMKVIRTKRGTYLQYVGIDVAPFHSTGLFQLIRDTNNSYHLRHSS